MHRDEKRHSLTTLIIGSISSAAAAVVVHQLWPSGTILGAAATPVLVTVFAEMLRRPVERITVPARRPPAGGESIRIYRSRPRLAPLALTAMAAFAAGAAGLTASEALLKRSIAEPGSRTTLFGGRPQHAAPIQSEPRGAAVSAGERVRAQPKRERTGRAPSRRAEAPASSPTPMSTPTPTPTQTPEPTATPEPPAPTATPPAPEPTPP